KDRPLLGARRGASGGPPGPLRGPKRVRGAGEADSIVSRPSETCTRTPSSLRGRRAASTTFVKTRGDRDRPKGRTLY
ncbi:hypothetical protein IRJ41_008576, partial [Triplophysa rosa]